MYMIWNRVVLLNVLLNRYTVGGSNCKDHAILCTLPTVLSHAQGLVLQDNIRPVRKDVDCSTLQPQCYNTTSLSVYHEGELNVLRKLSHDCINYAQKQDLAKAIIILHYKLRSI